MRGSIRKRGSGWQVRVYAGVYEGFGAKRTISRTVRGTMREAEEVLHRKTRCLSTEADVGALLRHQPGAR